MTYCKDLLAHEVISIKHIKNKTMVALPIINIVSSRVFLFVFFYLGFQQICALHIRNYFYNPLLVKSLKKLRDPFFQRTF